MKKTLVALAVLAAGAASAQVTITGNYTFGYQQVTGGDGGLVTDTANVQFSAKEDLGNGLTASAKVTAANLARSTDKVGGEDAAVTLAGGFGSVELSSKETGNGTGGAWIAPGYGLDGGNLFAAATPKDRITYKAPAMGAFGLAIAYTDRANGAAVGGGGTTGTVTSQNYATIGLTYADGPLSLGLTYATFMHRNLPAAKSQGFTLASAYDAGVAKVALSIDKSNTDAQAAYAFGVSAPLSSAFTVGLNYGSDYTGDKGYTVGANYALSKTVNVGVSTKDLGGANGKAFRVLVGKSF